MLESDAQAYARLSGLLDQALDTNDFDAALRLARATHVLAPTSGRDLDYLAKIHLFRRDYGRAAATFERLLAVGPADPIAVKFVIFASAQVGSCHRVERWASRLPALIATMPSGPDVEFLSQLGKVISGYRSFGTGLSTVPPLRFFDEDDEHEDNRFMRKALLASAEGLFQRALQYLSTLQFRAEQGRLDVIAPTDVAALQARLHQMLGIDRSRLGTGAQRGTLLIRSHSSGFTADLFHVVNQLIVAELARRRPVVFWGRESGYWRPESENLWNDFFDPIDGTTIAELAREARSFYPPFFGPSNLAASQNSAWLRNLNGASHETILGRTEDVAVAERFSTLPEILALLSKDHPWRQTNPLLLVKSIFNRFIRIRTDLKTRYAAWLREHAQGRPVVAAHYRLQTSGKLMESAQKRYVQIEEYFQRIDHFIANDREARIFALTDYEPALEAFRERYPGRVICYGAERLKLDSVTELQVGLKQPEGNYHLAEEVVRDFATAALCDYLVLDGSSNVSNAIYCLTEVPDSRVAWLRETNFGTIWTSERILPRLAGPSVMDFVTKV